MFLHPQIPQPQQMDGFLFKTFLSWLNVIATSIPLLYSLIVFVLFYVQAIGLNKLATSQKLFQKPNYLVGMCYLLLTSLFSNWQILSAPLIVSTLAIWVLTKLSVLHNIANTKTELFNIGLAIGICTFLYFPSVFFLIMILFGLIITRPVKVSEWLILLFGSITPYYFLLSYVFITDKWKGYKFPGVSYSIPSFPQTLPTYFAFSLVGLLFLISLVFIQQNYRKQLVQSRKTWSLIFLYLLISAIIPFVNATKTFSYWIFCAAPLALVIASAFFYIGKKWVSLAFHWLLVALTIWVGYFIR